MPCVTIVVSFPSSSGVYSNVTAADSVLDAVQKAWEFFHNPRWRGPKPNMETVFEVGFVADEPRWLVRAGRMEALR